MVDGRRGGDDARRTGLREETEGVGDGRGDVGEGQDVPPAGGAGGTWARAGASSGADDAVGAAAVLGQPVAAGDGVGGGADDGDWAGHVAPTKQCRKTNLHGLALGADDGHGGEEAKAQPRW